MRRVGGPLLRLIAATVIAAGSIAAALALLGVDPTPPSADDGDVRTAAGLHPANAPRPYSSTQALLDADAAASWAALESSLPARIGLAVAPLGIGKPLIFGSLQTGHAWSTIKVPILVTLLREVGDEGLSEEEERWARAALTASDNEAAAALFDRIETGQMARNEASRAVEGMLRQAGDGSTVVETAPPPSGAVSSYGQTEWSLAASVMFFRALGSDCLLDQNDTDYVLGLMEEVVAEQRWGLARARFDPAWQVAIKGGWGPEGSASGPYLVRQSGVLEGGDAGLAVAMIARADSGSFETGVEAIDQVSTWLRDNLRPLKPAGNAHCNGPSEGR